MNIGNVMGEIIGACIGLFILINVPNWHIAFITSSYATFIPIAAMVIIVTAILRILMHLIPLYRIDRLFEFAANLFNIYGLIALLTIFPLDFSLVNRPEINGIFRIGVQLIIFAIAIASLVTFVKFIVGPKQVS